MSSKNALSIDRRFAAQSNWVTRLVNRCQTVLAQILREWYKSRYVERIVWLGRAFYLSLSTLVRHHIVEVLAPATGLNSGTAFLEGFKRFSQEPPKDLS